MCRLTSRTILTSPEPGRSHTWPQDKSFLPADFVDVTLTAITMRIAVPESRPQVVPAIAHVVFRALMFIHLTFGVNSSWHHWRPVTTRSRSGLFGQCCGMCDHRGDKEGRTSGRTDRQASLLHGWRGPAGSGRAEPRQRLLLRDPTGLFRDLDVLHDEIAFRWGTALHQVAVLRAAKDDVRETACRVRRASRRR